MQHNNVIKLFLVFLLMLLIAVVDCTRKENRPVKNKIVVSILPLAEFVEKVAGDDVEITVMVPPGASPHAYEPKPDQLVKVSQANMYIKVGTPIEFEISWMDKIFAMNKTMQIVDASAGIDLLNLQQPHDHEAADLETDHESARVDPHIWLSPANAEIIIENIYNGLVTLNPSAKQMYFDNKKAYLTELANLDKTIEQKLRHKTNRRFLVYHPSWTYFAHRYFLEQIAIEHEGKEPTVRGIQSVINQAKDHGIKVVFASPQFNMHNAQIIAREIGGKVILISPLEKEYINNLMALTDSLNEALK